MTSLKKQRTSVVAILLEASEAFCVALFSVWKAGMAFLPLEASIPIGRIKKIVEQAHVHTVITTTSLVSRLDSISTLENIVLMDTGEVPLALKNRFNILHWPHEKKNRSFKELDRVYDPHKIAYLIYTSGTTGIPKGVPISHANLFPLMMWQKKKFEINQNTKLLQTLSLSFDFGIQEILTTLLFGGTLHFCSKEHKMCLESYRSLLRNHQITMLYSTPSFLEAILDEDKMPSLRVILIGGETLKHSLIQRLSKVVHKNCRIFNGYGPTEASINTTMHLAFPKQENSYFTSSVPIGKVSANNKIYIFNQSFKMVPLLVEGEIYIGGPGLAKGYWDNEEETQRCFKDNPYLFGEKIYKTGDKGRYLPDGTIEFLGRLDDQIKIRGYRIEPYEVEGIVKQHPLVKDAMILAKKTADGLCCLVCYFVAQEHRQIDVHALQTYLSERLPSYMIPQYFVPIRSIPMNKNGKLKGDGFPDFQNLCLGKNHDQSKPQNLTEEIIIAAFKRVLSIPEVGTRDNFFDIGGHSLMAGKVHAQLVEELKVNFPISKLFLYPNARLLAKYLSNEENTDQANKAQVSKAIEQREAMRARYEHRCSLGLIKRV